MTLIIRKTDFTPSELLLLHNATRESAKRDSAITGALVDGANDELNLNKNFVILKPQLATFFHFFDGSDDGFYTHATHIGQLLAR